MSFRTRLTSFFVVIVVLPMVAVGFPRVRAYSAGASRAKADARAYGPATASATRYQSERAAARARAATLGWGLGSVEGGALRARVTAPKTQAGLARVRETALSSLVLDPPPAPRAG